MARDLIKDTGPGDEEWSHRILPNLDGSSLETMRRRVAAALADQREHCARACQAVADRLEKRANKHYEEGDQGSAIVERDKAQGARDCAAAIREERGRS